MNVELTEIIVALVTASATAGGFLASRKGQREQTAVQQAANVLADERDELEGLRKLVADNRFEVDRAYAQRDEARKEAAGCYDEITRLRREILSLRSDLAVMSTVVRSEVARAAYHTGVPGQIAEAVTEQWQRQAEGDDKK